MGSLPEQSDLARVALERWDRDVHISDASLYKGLGLLGVLALAQFVAANSKADHKVDETLSDFVEIDEKTTGVCVHVECLVEVLAMVNLLDELNDDFRDAINLLLLTHKVNLVVQSLCHLEHRVDQEAVTQLLRL